MRRDGVPIRQATYLLGCFATIMAALLILITAFPSMVVGAEGKRAEGKRIAFVVGINRYDNLGEKQLERAADDAREISRTLKNLGFDVTEGIDVTISEFDTKWQAILEKITSEDTLVFFFSGHGVEVDAENMLLPRDIPYFQFGRHTQFKRKAISVSQLMEDLKTGDRQQPKVTVMILDACRDNPTIPPEYRTKGGAPQGGLAKVQKTRGTFMMYAAEPGKVSLDRLGPGDTDPNSVYTRSLLSLLKQPNLTIQDLAIKVKQQVYDLTQKVGYDQLPEYTDGLIGQFCLAGCVAKANEGAVGYKENMWTSAYPTLQNEITGKDGAPMVLIPAGEFWMGSTENQIEDVVAIQCGYAGGSKEVRTLCQRYPKAEGPLHRVNLEAYYMDKFEVTVSRYAEFMRETNRAKPYLWDQVDISKHRNFPVLWVDWHGALAYCTWAGKRLPTEAEWEKAARGADGRIFPWGNEPPTGRFGNFGKWLTTNLDDPLYDGRSEPVDRYEAGKSPYGLHHMAGNVYEWTADWFDENYYKQSLEHNPKGPSSGRYRVIRGGSWHGSPIDVRSAARAVENPSNGNGMLGFRCAQDIPR